MVAYSSSGRVNLFPKSTPKQTWNICNGIEIFLDFSIDSATGYRLLGGRFGTPMRLGKGVPQCGPHR